MMNFNVRAASGNADGIFDGAYSFGRGVGGDGEMTGTPAEIGQEVTRFLASLDRQDVETMKYGTKLFFIELIIEPVDDVPSQLLREGLEAPANLKPKWGNDGRPVQA